MRPSCRWVAIGITASALAASPLVYAGLGGSIDSVTADRASMKAQLSTANPTADYSVQTLQLPSGTVVHEYASATGTVFAVTWSGPSLPDLSTVLGAYLSDYVAAAAAPYHDHHHVAISSTDLVVQSSGRMGSFSGRAYVPSLLPPNVSASDIQ